jgi:hypothetical protein
MADEKVKGLEVIRPRRRIELRDFPLAAFYPQNQSTTPSPAITTDLESLRKRQHGDPSPAGNVAKPWNLGINDAYAGKFH